MYYLRECYIIFLGLHQSISMTQWFLVAKSEHFLVLISTDQLRSSSLGHHVPDGDGVGTLML